MSLSGWKKRKLCYQFIINANGAVLDGRYRDSSRLSPDSRWCSGIEAVVSRQKSKWIAQARIPLADVGITGEPGTKVALNIYRNRVCGGDPTFSGWSPTGPRTHLTAPRFGEVSFVWAWRG